jgi:hypothetical protein
MKSLKLQLSEIQLRVKSLTATPLIVKAKMEFPARADYNQGIVVQPQTITYWRLPQLIGYLPS